MITPSLTLGVVRRGFGCSSADNVSVLRADFGQPTPSGGRRAKIAAHNRAMPRQCKITSGCSDVVFGQVLNAAFDQSPWTAICQTTNKAAGGATESDRAHTDNRPRNELTIPHRNGC
jgi:hypothetical protein